ncbi:unnamed protein product [Cuscuta campestris]|uniref:Dolichyl-diphosphooligosaccharide--protein glycosyltransferase subunit 1 n=1 Tax=Cuscuta campestris TaxID=132261 RepID=A0A484L3L0_9ASTE|nr:unnamed protein product [Cuscuta campestris]
MKKVNFVLHLLLGCLSVLSSAVISDLSISKLDRKIDLTSQVIRSTTSLKIYNSGNDPATEVLLPFPGHQAEHLAFLIAATSEGKVKAKMSSGSLPVKVVNPDGLPTELTWYAVSLPKELGKGDSISLEVKAVLTRLLRPFPEKITQTELQLFIFQDSAHFLSPYSVHTQSLTLKLPEPMVESYTKVENTQFSGSELKYGPYQNVPPFSFQPIAVHFVCNKPFVVAEQLVKEIEISHWGNVQVTEHYTLAHAGAQSTGEFSRLDYQTQQHIRGAPAFRNLVARLPPRAHSIYYRDDIGNISTSNLWSDAIKTLLEIEPRYPMFGGWKTSFTIGYGLPLQDFLFYSDGGRFLNITFGSPINEVVIDNLVVKVVLPEGSNGISISAPFPFNQRKETKLSHLDMIGRPVVVLKKTNVVPEHNQYFQVYYMFNSFSLFREPMMLISGFFFFFLTCIIYVHADLTISKSSASYLARKQWDEVQTAIQEVESIINHCLTIHDTLESSLRYLSRTGDIQACKAARKAADGALKELSVELKPLLSPLQSFPQAGPICHKVNDLVEKEKELQEKLLLKHSIVIDCYEKKSGGRDIEKRVAQIQQKITSLRQEVDDILQIIDDI